MRPIIVGSARHSLLIDKWHEVIDCWQYREQPTALGTKVVVFLASTIDPGHDQVLIFFHASSLTIFAVNGYWSPIEVFRMWRSCLAELVLHHISKKLW